MAQRRDLLSEVAGVAGDVAAVYALPGIDVFLDRVCSVARAVSGAESCSVAVVDEDQFELEFRAASGRGADAIRGMRLPLDAGLAGFVASSGHAITVEDVTADPRHAADVAQEVGYTPRSMVVVPITKAGGEIVGVLSILDRSVDAIGSRSLLDVAAELADLAGLGIVVGGHAQALGASLLGALGDAAPVEGDAARRSLSDALRARAELDESTSETAEVAARFAELRALGPGVTAAAANIVDELIAFARATRGRRR